MRGVAHLLSNLGMKIRQGRSTPKDLGEGVMIKDGQGR